MKIKLLFNLIMFSFVSNCIGQVRSSMISDDSSYIDKHLPEFKISSCLLDLFVAIVKADRRDFNGKKYFYSLTFEMTNKYRYINVSHERWNAVKHLDYHGLIKINGVLFLCRGEFEHDSLFHKIDKSELQVKLRHSMDSADVTPFSVEPSLQGSYVECKGLPITLEIYIQNTIPGFKMKNRPPPP